MFEKKSVSIFTQIFTTLRNKVLIFGLYFETLLATFIIYCPGMDSFLKMYPLNWSWWLLPIPWALLIFAYDEIRRLLIRKSPTGESLVLVHKKFSELRSGLVILAVVFLMVAVFSVVFILL